MKAKIMIAIPCMDQVPAPFAQSLAMIRKGNNDVAVAFQMGSLIYTSRNNLAIQSARLETDYTLWLDSDMTFQQDLIAKLQKTLEENELDMVSGLYFRRQPPFTPVIFSKLDITEDGGPVWEPMDDVPEKLTEVEGIGFGCVLMKTPIFADVQQEFGDMFGPLAGFGEDLSFCWRARQLGYKIHIDPEIECGHVGYTVIGQKFYQSFRSTRRKEEN